MVGDDHVNPQSRAERNLVKRGNAVVYGYDELDPVGVQRAHRIGRHTITFGVPVRNVVFHVGAHLLQALHQHRGRTNAVGIIVAVDADVFPFLNGAPDSIRCRLHIRQQERVE